MPIRFKEVSYTYSPGTPFAYLALKHINLELTEGKMTAVIGATGSGKSTMVQHLNALLLPTEGSLEVGEHTIKAGEKIRNIKPLRKNVGYVFQFAEYQLFEETLAKDIAFGPKNIGIEEDEIETRVRDAMAIVGLDYDEFSGKSPFDFNSTVQPAIPSRSFSRCSLSYLCITIFGPPVI